MTLGIAYPVLFWGVWHRKWQLLIKSNNIYTLRLSTPLKKDHCSHEQSMIRHVNAEMRDLCKKSSTEGKLLRSSSTLLSFLWIWVTAPAGLVIIRVRFKKAQFWLLWFVKKPNGVYPKSRQVMDVLANFGAITLSIKFSQFSCLHCRGLLSSCYIESI